MRVGMNSPDADLEPHAVLGTEKERAPAPYLVSHPTISDARGSSGVENLSEIGTRSQLRAFDNLAERVFHDEPCRLILHE